VGPAVGAGEWTVERICLDFGGGRGPGGGGVRLVHTLQCDEDCSRGVQPGAEVACKAAPEVQHSRPSPAVDTANNAALRAIVGIP